MPKVAVRNNQVEFDCPGCGDTHSLPMDRWQFNGDVEKPTITPSILARCGHYADKGVHDHDCWCDYNAKQREKGEPESGFECFLCHSFVREGKIEFLSDCSHGLAGQTVEMGSAK